VIARVIVPTRKTSADAMFGLITTPVA